jgi:GT2 family glycosyltransferase
MKKVSWINVTWNRLETNRRCYESNTRQGREETELIWIDNGSIDGTAEYAASLRPDVLVLNKENQGFAKAFNTGLALATGDYIVISGPDMIAHEHWLRDMRSILDAGWDFCAMYSPEIGGKLPERLWGEAFDVAGISCRRCKPAEHMMVTRKLFYRVGYLSQDYGLYGWCDEEWNLRTHRLGFKGVALPDVVQHFGTTGMDDHHSEHETPEYWQFKVSQAKEQWKIDLLEKRKQEGFPYHNPFIAAH